MKAFLKNTDDLREFLWYLADENMVNYPNSVLVLKNYLDEILDGSSPCELPRQPRYDFTNDVYGVLGTYSYRLHKWFTTRYFSPDMLYIEWDHENHMSTIEFTLPNCEHSTICIGLSKNKDTALAIAMMYSILAWKENQDEEIAPQ